MCIGENRRPEPTSAELVYPSVASNRHSLPNMARASLVPVEFIGLAPENSESPLTAFNIRRACHRFKNQDICQWRAFFPSFTKIAERELDVEDQTHRNNFVAKHATCTCKSRADKCVFDIDYTSHEYLVLHKGGLVSRVPMETVLVLTLL